MTELSEFFVTYCTIVQVPIFVLSVIPAAKVTVTESRFAASTKMSPDVAALFAGMKQVAFPQYGFVGENAKKLLV